MKIITNNVPRKLVYGYELPKHVRDDFDYLSDDDFEFRDFVKYKNQYFDLCETMVTPKDSPLEQWHSYTSDSYFSGHVFKIVDQDTVIVGHYYS